MPDLPAVFYIPAFSALVAVIAWQGLALRGVLTREQERSDRQATLMEKFVVVPKDRDS